jgi:heme A synthase
MFGTVINIAISFAGVVVFGAALVLALVGLVLICIARKNDRPVELSPRAAGACFLFVGAGIASGVFALLVGAALR